VIPKNEQAQRWQPALVVREAALALQQLAEAFWLLARQQKLAADEIGYAVSPRRHS
jgi:hypothetical protein